MTYSPEAEAEIDTLKRANAQLTEQLRDERALVGKSAREQLYQQKKIILGLTTDLEKDRARRSELLHRHELAAGILAEFIALRGWIEQPPGDSVKDLLERAEAVLDLAQKLGDWPRQLTACQSCGGNLIHDRSRCPGCGETFSTDEGLKLDDQIVDLGRKLVSAQKRIDKVLTSLTALLELGHVEAARQILAEARGASVELDEDPLAIIDDETFDALEASVEVESYHRRQKFHEPTGDRVCKLAKLVVVGDVVYFPTGDSTTRRHTASGRVYPWAREVQAIVIDQGWLHFHFTDETEQLCQRRPHDLMLIKKRSGE